ncbi:MAG TPA: TIGR03936 family radical SAM-associated protein [Anaerolineales bacterium]|nr:TIGR03936 family radical SAM-associated protein [Anaerolineales bacterium]
MRIQITFSKQGPLRYTGHLDLHKLWERAARRAELPLAYSQGFHPQPKMNIAAALPLGFSSRCEVLDMRLERDIPLDGLIQKLNDTMPEGIRVTHIEQADERAPALQTQVVSAEYEVTSKETGFGSDLKRTIDSVMESESIIRTRRNKEYDLRPLIEELELTSDSKLYMKLTSKEGATGRPEEVLDVLVIAFEETRIERVRLNFLS